MTAARMSAVLEKRDLLVRSSREWDWFRTARGGLVWGTCDFRGEPHPATHANNAPRPASALQELGQVLGHHRRAGTGLHRCGSRLGGRSMGNELGEIGSQSTQGCRETWGEAATCPRSWWT